LRLSAFKRRNIARASFVFADAGLDRKVRTNLSRKAASFGRSSHLQVDADPQLAAMRPRCQS